MALLMDAKTQKLYSLARRQLDAGDLELAYGMGCSAIKQFPNSVELLQLTALAAFKLNLAQEAKELCERALEGNPNDHILAYNYATILLHLEEGALARKWLTKSLEFNPDYSPAHANLASILISYGELDDALKHLERCVELGGLNSEVLINRACALRDLGETTQAIQDYEKAIELDPTSHIAYSNYLLCLNYTQNQQAVIKACHEKWGRSQNAGTSSNPRPPLTDKIKIGYVSPDFRRHSVAFFLESVLRNHDKEQFEITCFSNTQREDAITQTFKGLADQWVDIKNLSSQEASQAVKDANIHILIDLAAHTAHNRLDIFAHRSAPIQITWLGYPNTSGLPNMDYRIGDPLTDPPEFAEHYTETLVHLPNTFICFNPPPDYPQLDNLPTDRTEPVTFGSFNLLAKINEEVVEAWAKILKGVPESRLILKSRQLASTQARTRYLKLFESHGINPERISLKSHVNSFMDHLNLYKQIDIGLDPFPYHGTTTTCEALLMGTPVLTLAGERHSCRVGVSLLSAVGLENWVAKDVNEYIEKAITFAAHSKDNPEQRLQIRNQFLESALCNTQSFTKDLESLFQSLVQSKGQ